MMNLLSFRNKKALLLFAIAQSCSAAILIRQDNSCPSEYATAGLNFKTYCLQTFPNNGDVNSTTTADMPSCMDACANWVPTSTGLCAGISFDTSSGDCHLKSSVAATSALLSQSSTVMSAIGQFEIQDITCQYQNGSLANSTDGQQFQILCSQDMPVDDYCDTGLDGGCNYHAASLSECMDRCSEAHNPVCKGAVFKPYQTTSKSYANCFLKKDISTSSYKYNTIPIAHMAVARLPTLESTECPSNLTFTAPSGATYRLSCNSDDQDSDLQVSHAPDLGTCTDACINYRNSTPCIGVVFDQSMINGWENCYLRGSLKATPNPRNQFFVATLLTGATTTVTSVASTSTSALPTIASAEPNPGHYGSKGWIVAAVIGPLMGVAVLAAIFILLRRRQRQSRQKAYHQDMTSQNWATLHAADRKQLIYTENELPAQNIVHEAPSVPRYEVDTDSPAYELAGSLPAK